MFVLPLKTVVAGPRTSRVCSSEPFLLRSEVPVVPVFELVVHLLVHGVVGCVVGVRLGLFLFVVDLAFATIPLGDFGHDGFTLGYLDVEVVAPWPYHLG